MKRKKTKQIVRLVQPPRKQVTELTQEEMDARYNTDIDNAVRYLEREKRLLTKGRKMPVLKHTKLPPGSLARIRQARNRQYIISTYRPPER